jgi:hypothetical protein
MYRESETHKQIGLFNNSAAEMGERSQRLYEDPTEWHNEFRRQVTNRVDESVFKPLFHETTGSPNAPIRILVAMMILKEGKGFSDEELYEQARFNLRCRSALGLVNSEEEPPVESTYYLFRRRIVEYEERTGINLLEEAFRSITREQCREFGVSGRRIRMDSKLLGSNLAWYTRYEVVHETIRKYWNSRSGAAEKLTVEELHEIDRVTREAGHTVYYRSTKEELKERLESLGRLIYWMLKDPGAEGNREYGLLKRVFEEQYAVETGPGGGKEERVRLREKAERPSKIVTNPHDVEAEYRKKGEKVTAGYSINVTESCDEGKLNLIVDVRTAGAGTADNAFFEAALEGAQGAVGDKIAEAYTDGAYHCPGNQEYCREKEIDWTLRGISGKPSKYELSYSGTGELVVYNRETREYIPAKRSQTKDPRGPARWVIRDGERAPVYFEDTDVVVSALRRKIEGLPKERLNIRNNVEATVFQLGYHYRGNKSRYRGLKKHRMWAVSRCLWVNFRRIGAWLGKRAEELGLCPAVQGIAALIDPFRFALSVPACS